MFNYFNTDKVVQVLLCWRILEDREYDPNELSQVLITKSGTVYPFTPNTFCKVKKGISMRAFSSYEGNFEESYFTVKDITEQILEK